jgi:CRISPR-associated endonuclease/helicase Cas3
MPKFPSDTNNEEIPAIGFENCIGKTFKNGKSLDVYSHCLYAGLVAGILQKYLPAESSKNNLPLLAAIHDIGKVSPGFQKKISIENVRKLCPKLAEMHKSFEEAHAVVSEATIKSVFKNAMLAEIAGAHHGERRTQVFNEPNSCYGGEKWFEERKRLLKALECKFCSFSDHKIDELQRNILSGFVCVSDWIASDESFFNPDLKEDAEAVAEKAVNACGWRKPNLKQDLSFKEIFGFEPNSIQKSFADSVRIPGLYILEAPMGAGKTEAALYAAYTLISSGQNNGLYFGLPTKLTSDKIHERVQSFLEKVSLEKENAILAHSSAWLNLGGGEEFETGNSWFHPRKRSLLAPFGVGTIDQALLGVLCVKHFFVRLFGLSGKVVILDEVHSYDAFTGILLDELVRTLREIACTVIILSATLTKDRKKSFLPTATPNESNDYPLISIETNASSFFTAPEYSDSKTINITIEKQDIRKLSEIAVERASSGQCVLVVTNTVPKSQEFYSAIKATMKGNPFPAGLLHSRFPAFRRREIEDEWINKLGKEGNRPKGCILVGTQILEQSIDIDSDFLMTEIAPSDMLLQRIGRLWRHQRNNSERGGCELPEAVIISENIDAASDEKQLKEIFKNCGSKVYAPYVLWKTFQTWKSLSKIQIPSDIREILETTYKRDEKNEPEFVKNLFDDLEQKKLELRNMATGLQSSNCGIPAGKDDEEKATTRYNEMPQKDCLIVKNIISNRDSAEIELLSGDTVKVSAYERNFNVTKMLHKNIVSIPAYALKNYEIRTPEYLKKHFYGNIAVLVLEDGILKFDNADIGRRYTNEKGVFRNNSLKSVQQGLDYTSFEKEFGDESDW